MDFERIWLNIYFLDGYLSSARCDFIEKIYIFISKFSIFRYVWFWAKDISISHDSYTCRSYPYTKSFPTQRKNEINNFVGAVVGDEWKIWEECPTKCRPKDHLDWTYC